MFSLALLLLVLQTKAAFGDGEYACEGNTLSISCKDEHSVLDVYQANYGRTSSAICQKSGLDSNTQCISSTATKIVSQQCNGAKSCSIKATNEVFQDPCVDTYKYLEVNYTCVNPQTPAPAVPVCSGNEKKGCVNCIQKCQDPPGKPKGECKDNCISGCVCKDEYLRDTSSGMCVGKKYCPLDGSPCDTHEKYSDCDADCQLTCQDKNPKKCDKCVPGYICDTRYLRDKKSGLCVLPKDCSK